LTLLDYEILHTIFVMLDNDVNTDKCEKRAVIKYLFLKGMSGKDIHDDMLATLGDNAPLNRLSVINPCMGLTVDSSQLTFVPSCKSRDTKTRANIKNPTQSNLDTVP